MKKGYSIQLGYTIYLYKILITKQYALPSLKIKQL